MREDAGPNPLGALRFVCKQHALVHPGACPICKVIEHYDREIALIREQLQMMEGTIDQLRAKRRDGW